MPKLALPRPFRSSALLLVTACGGGGGTPPTTPPASAVYAAVATAGASQSKTAGAASDPMTVKITKDGAALANAVVSWTTTGGTLASASSTTNASGEATNSLTSVGSAAGSVTVTASSNGKSAAFNVTVSAPAAGPPASLRYLTKIALLDSAGSVTVLPEVKDANGVTVANASITYTSRVTATATVNGNGQISGVKRGTATIVASVTSGSTTFTDSLVAVVGVPDGPIVVTDVPRFDLKGDTTFTVTILADMRASTTKLGSGKVTLTWNTSQLTYQSHTEGASNVGATVNANDAANGTLTLAFANSTGFGGKVELRKVTFKAATAAATTGSLTATANEAYAAGTYADLLARTVSVALPLVTR